MSYLHILKDNDGTGVFMDRTHYFAHQGKSFTAHHNNSSLSSGATINVYFKTPTTGRIHFIYNSFGSGAYDIELLEAPTVTAGTGTNGVSIFNKNRESVTVSGLLDNATTPVSNKISRDVTITASGTILKNNVFGSGKVGGNYSGIRELILKQNTAYAIRLTSRASSNRVHIDIDWYEN